MFVTLKQCICNDGHYLQVAVPEAFVPTENPHQIHHPPPASTQPSYSPEIRHKVSSASLPLSPFPPIQNFFAA
ncbi:hypothetical protein Hanom_Chr02g00102931 [Helianthus anomalus]